MTDEELKDRLEVELIRNGKRKILTVTEVETYAKVTRVFFREQNGCGIGKDLRKELEQNGVLKLYDLKDFKETWRIKDFDKNKSK